MTVESQSRADVTRGTAISIAAPLGRTAAATTRETKTDAKA